MNFSIFNNYNNICDKAQSIEKGTSKQNDQHSKKSENYSRTGNSEYYPLKELIEKKILSSPFYITGIQSGITLIWTIYHIIIRCGVFAVSRIDYVITENRLIA